MIKATKLLRQIIAVYDMIALQHATRYIRRQDQAFRGGIQEPYIFMMMVSFLGAILHYCYITYAYNALDNIYKHNISKNPRLNFCEILNKKRYITLPCECPYRSVLHLAKEVSWMLRNCIAPEYDWSEVNSMFDGLRPT